MKKLLIGASLLLLCFAGKAQTKPQTGKPTTSTTTKEVKMGYSLCANLIAAKTIMFAGFTHNDIAFRLVYLRDANKCAQDAMNMYLEYKDGYLKEKLTTTELGDLEKSVNFFVNITNNPEATTDWSDQKIQGLAVMSQLLDTRFVNIFTKLMR